MLRYPLRIISIILNQCHCLPGTNNFLASTKFHLMKALGLIALLLLAAVILPAQNQSLVPAIGKHLTDFFARQPHEQLLVTTDKSVYHPSEKIWFRVVVLDENNQISTIGKELFVKLYGADGKSDSQQLFKLKEGYALCDLTLKPEMKPGTYFLSLFTSATNQPDFVSITRVLVDPEYSNQWVATGKSRDSISRAGIKNELIIRLKEFAGDIKKNTSLLYQITNGTSVLEKGKVKTDKSGEVAIPFTLPSTSNGAPFLCRLSDNREEWNQTFYLPSEMDQITVGFFPEGGNLVPGIESKIGMTAVDHWGNPVALEGTLTDQDGKTVAQVKTFTAGLGFFSLRPEANKKYMLSVNSKKPHHQQFELPPADSSALALSIAKNDAEYLSVNLQFANQQKHNLSMIVTKGSNLYWAADLEIIKGNRIKIPVLNLPQGINLLSVFSAEGKPMAERLIFVEQKEACQISITPEKDSLAQGESVKIKIRMNDENNHPLPGNFLVAITDNNYLDKNGSDAEDLSQAENNLTTPISMLAGGTKGKLTNTTLTDIFLISNHLKWLNWNQVLPYPGKQPNQPNGTTIQQGVKNFDTQLSGLIEDRSVKCLIQDQPRKLDSAYLLSNATFFKKTPRNFKSNTIALENQRKMFASATSILDVIKSIKPFKITNNQIVFLGSENSINYQGGALIILDGQQLGTDVSALSAIAPMEVDHINVSTNPMDIQRYTGLNSVGIIEIFLKKAVTKPEEPSSASTDPYENGFRIPATFPTMSDHPRQDGRTTLQWIPLQKSDQNGQTEISVMAGARSGDFVVRVVGITDSGRFGNSQSLLKINK